MRMFRRSRSTRRRARWSRRGRSLVSRWRLVLAVVTVGAAVFSWIRRRATPTTAPATSASGRVGGPGDAVPEADWLDQRRDVVAAPPPARPSADPEAPIADALDQAAPVGPTEIVDPPSRDPEAPEADALEHAISLPPDDEDAGDR